MSDDEDRSRGNKLVDEEADDSEDEGDYVDSSEEDADELGEEDDNKDGFFVDEASGDEDDDSHKERKRKRKRSLAQQELDEEDFVLLEENTGQTFKRGGQLKRLKKRAQHTEEHEGKEAFERNFFGDEGEIDIEDDVEDDTRFVHEQVDLNHLDEMDDFIVPERGNEADYNRYRATMRRQGQIGGISADAAQEIFELFAPKEKPLEELLHDFDESQKVAEMDTYDAELDEDDDEIDDEGRPRQRAAAKRTDTNDPTLLERNYMTEADDQVKGMDLPEREQLARAGLITDQFDLKACAQWIYNQVFAHDASASLSKGIVEQGVLEMDGLDLEEVAERPGMLVGVSPQPGIQSFRLLRRARGMGGESWMDISEWQQDDAAQEALRTAIFQMLQRRGLRKRWDCAMMLEGSPGTMQVIQAIYQKHFEIPPIGMFLKEICGELLSMRHSDAPSIVDQAECKHLANSGIYVATGAVLAYGRRIRRWDVLWAVYNASHQWLSLRQHKEAKKKLLDKAMARASGDVESMRLMDFENELENIETHEELEDWSANFRLHLQNVSADTMRMQMLSLEADEPAQRRPSKGTKYHACIQAGLKALADKLVLHADQFAENVATITAAHPQGYSINEVQDDKTKEPKQVADFHAVAGTAFPTADLCLQGARHIIVCELAAHPTIRSTVRRLYRDLAVVTTEPTEAGELELDPFHVHGIVKRIRNKPISDMELSDRFLHMVTAERKKLIKVKMGIIPDAYITRMLEPFSMLYCSNDVHPVSDLFNDFRKGLLTELLENHLLPQMEREFRHKLLQQARQQVLDEMGDALWKLATLPPLRLKCEEEDSDRFVANQRTMAVCYGPGSSADNRRGAATHMVMLDARGYPIDILSLPQLSGMIPRARKVQNPDGIEDIYDCSQDPRKAHDIERMQTFIRKHWPHVIVIGASSLECRQLLADIKQVTEMFPQEDLIDHLEDTKTIHVRLVEENVAAICEESSFARDDLKEFAPIVRRAVALGRSVIDPLAVLCSLASAEREILSIQLHPLQEYVSEEDRWRTIEQLLVTVVSQVGAPVNAMVNIDWMSQTLQFVPGLGPRKARALLKAVKQLEEPVVEERDNLLAAAELDPEDPYMPCRILGTVVYKNAAPYLRICGHEGITALAHRDFDATNDIRFHPDDYLYLLQLARITMDLDVDDDSHPNPVLMASHKKEDIMKLDVYAYNQLHMEQEAGDNRLSVFLDLQMELMEPYGELRPKERAAMTEVEEFYALSGENALTMAKGKLVSATVVWVGRDQAKAKLDNGLIGTVDIEDVKRNRPHHMQDVMKNGMEVTARIKDIDFTHFQLRLVTRSDTLTMSEWFEGDLCQSIEPYYHVLTEEERTAALHQQKAKGPGRRAFISRPITYPLFQNVSMAAATADLQKDGTADGTIIIRPSAKSTERLALSIRLFTRDDNAAVIQHIDIHEPSKGGAAGSHLRLGAPLHIPTAKLKREDCTFEDLDEVYTRYVQPYMKCINEVKQHKKFVLLPRDKLDQALAQSAQGYDYRLGLWYDKPGMGFISWISGRGQRVHHCHFTVSHMGYCLSLPNPDGSGATSRQERNVEKLVAAFKQHMSKVMRAQQARAAMDHQQRGPDAYQMPYSHGRPYGQDHDRHVYVG